MSEDLPEIPSEEAAADYVETEGAVQFAATEEVAETAEIHADEKEETPVIDIHEPHGGVHTWKDFWIHLGTITVGLLIAIGLEQGVEKLHHLEQGRQLEADLQQEALVNRDRIAMDEAALDSDMAWLLRLRRNVSALRDGAPKQSFVYPERPETYPSNPNRSFVRLPYVTVWTTAQESNLIPLLPQERARNYASVHLEADLATNVLLGLQEAKWPELDKFELRFEDDVLSGKPNVGKMTPAQLDEYVGVIGDVFLACRTTKRRVKVYHAWNESILAPRYKPFESPDEYLRAHPDPPIDLSK
jgi:hypothetical protein